MLPHAYQLTGPQLATIAQLAAGAEKVLIQPSIALEHALDTGPVWATPLGGRSIRVGVNGDVLETE